MITLVFAWAISGFVMGYTGGSHDVKVLAWILLLVAVVMWVVNTLYTGWVENRNASAVLDAVETRRRSGGAL